MKAKIIAFGNLQAIGFRTYAKLIAKRLQIKGYAKNRDDGSVEIYANAPKRVIEKFLQRINVKGDKDNILSLHVEATTVYPEGHKNYLAPITWPFPFDIHYGACFSTGTRELIEAKEAQLLILAE